MHNCIWYNKNSHRYRYRYVYVKTTSCIQATPHGDCGQDALPVLSHVDEAATRIKLTKYGEWNEYFSAPCTHDSCTNSSCLCQRPDIGGQSLLLGLLKVDQVVGIDAHGFGPNPKSYSQQVICCS